MQLYVQEIKRNENLIKFVFSDKYNFGWEQIYCEKYIIEYVY